MDAFMCREFKHVALVLLLPFLVVLLGFLYLLVSQSYHCQLTNSDVGKPTSLNLFPPYGLENVWHEP
jgi:hypothetical protein